MINNYSDMLLIQSDLALVYELLGRVDASDVQGGYTNGIIVFWINYINNILLQKTPLDSNKNRWQDLSMVLKFVHLFNPYASPGDYASGVVVFWIDAVDQRLLELAPQEPFKADWQAAHRVHAQTKAVLTQWINHQVDSTTAENEMLPLFKDIEALVTRVQDILATQDGISKIDLAKMTSGGPNNTRLNFILATSTPHP